LRRGPDEEDQPVSTFTIDRGNTLAISFPAALQTEPPPEWIFWPSGICELAVVDFKGRDGEWKARYSPLTARPDLLSYVAR
jgi:hypothetical protein